MKHFGLTIFIYLCWACHVSKGLFIPPSVSLYNEEGRKRHLADPTSMQDLKATISEKIFEKLALTADFKQFLHRRRHQNRARLNRINWKISIILHPKDTLLFVPIKQLLISLIILFWLDIWYPLAICCRRQLLI